MDERELGSPSPHKIPEVESPKAIDVPPAHTVSRAENQGEMQINPRTNRELTDLHRLAEHHDARSEFIPIGEAGFVVRMEKKQRVIKSTHYEADNEDDNGTTIDFAIRYKQAWEGKSSTKPIISIDADDTLFAYTETKKPRDEAFAKFVTDELGYQPSTDILVNLMAISDEFSRWQEGNADEKMYHIQSHKWALNWATSQLKGVSLENIPAKVEHIRSTLARVKEGINTDQHPDESLPFHFREDELVLNNFIPSPNINNVFDPVYEPEFYLDAIGDVQTLAEEGALTVGYTLGEPPFQFDKLLRLRDKLLTLGEGWPYEYIFLTKIPKGEFLERLLETQDAQLREDLFSQDPHVFMHVDDSKNQTDDFLRAQQTVESNSGARLSVVHSLRDRTKSWKRREVAYKDVPGMGRVVDANERQQVHIHGDIEDVSSDMSYDVQRAHRDALSNLRLRIYLGLASSLAQISDNQAELRPILEPQLRYFSQTASDIERLIESSNGIRAGTL